MAVKTVLRPMSRARAGPTGWGATEGSGMGRLDAAAVVATSVAVVVLIALTKQGEALCYLVAFPVWIVSRDLGGLAAAGVGVFALVCVAIAGTADGGGFGPLGYLTLAAVLAGAIVAGGKAVGTGRIRPPAPLLRMLTERPDVTRRSEALSRRELQILEAIATGAKNQEIADRFVISQNTVKSHVSQILKKLSVANRTEAAFRYVELYGSPSTADKRSGDSGADAPRSDHIGARVAVGAKVSELRRDGKLELRLEDGRDLEVPALEEIRSRVEVGASVIVYFDQHDRVVGWYLPGEELGVDLRHWVQ